MPSAKPGICFVAPNAYAVLSGRQDLSHIGGAEIQQLLIGRELAQRGYRVSFITIDHGQADGIEHQGMRVFKMSALDDGLPGLRFIHPRWTSLCRAMRRADADIYYQRNNGVETGQVSIWCGRHRRRFIYAVSSDANCQPRPPGLRTRRERLLYRIGLRHADMIIAQTEIQKRMLERNLGLDSVLIRSCSLDPYPGSLVVPLMPRDRVHILWVGRIVPLKRLEIILDLAERFPNYIFDIVGEAPPDSVYGRQIRERAVKLPNMIFHGRVPQTSVGSFYEKSSLLLCTSEYEGYPNTFMEAWARGVPTVSTVDPDRTISRYRLGRVSTSLEGLSAALTELVTSHTEWQTLSENARRFYLENHTIRTVADAYERLFKTIVESGSSSAASVPERISRSPEINL